MKRSISKAGGELLLLLALAVPCAGASYVETFDDLTGSISEVNWAEDGPQALIDRGWVFRNQSEPPGDVPHNAWQGGDLWEAHEGSGSLAVKSGSAETGGAVSQWAILPAIPDLQTGDELVFHARRLLVENEDVLEVRYSPSGGTATGAGPTGVGDFTEVLLTLAPPNDTGWERHSVTVPGPGRLALRYALDWVRPWQFSYLGIDTLSVGGEVANCNQPPPPAAGRTVVWPAAGSPWEICADITIPPTAVVQVEAGAVVAFEAGRRLTVQGRLDVAGEAVLPASFTSPDPDNWAVRVQEGELHATHASWDLWVWADRAAELVFDDCTFGPSGMLESNGRSLEPWSSPYVELRDTAFEDSRLDLDHAVLAMRRTRFLRSSAVMRHVYLLIDGVEAQDAPGPGLEIHKDDQRVFLDGVSVTGSAGAGLVLSGTDRGNDFLLGAGVALEGNAHPVTLQRGGFVPGTFLPATGNERDIVLFDGKDGAPGPRTWPDVGLPYVMDETVPGSGGPWRIDPGVTLLMAPGTSLTFGGTEPLLARGEPNRPVRFLPRDPGLPWNFIAADGLGGRFEDCLIEGGENGVSAPSSFVHLQSCVLRDNGIAAHTSGVTAHLNVDKTRFEGNRVAVQADPSALSTTGGLAIGGWPNPNAFEGNDLAVEALATQEVQATMNWWGDPSGPQSGDNPAGTGDPVTGGVLTVPFLDSPPDFTDTPPRVELRHRPYFLVETGAPVYLEWEVSDDDAVTGQRILYRPTFNPDSQWFELVADLPPDRRSFLWTVPPIETQTSGGFAFIRIEAVDTAAQTGFDEAHLVIPSGELTSTARLTTDLSGTFRPGEEVEICYELVDVDGGLNGHDVWFLLDGDQRRFYVDQGRIPCLVTPKRMPYVSTDTARIGVRLRGSGCCNDVSWSFSDCFGIRPPAELGDLPPTVDLLSPPGGEFRASGRPLELVWEAGDDEGIRSFDVQVSFDGGRTWHDLAAELGPAARSFTWTPPAELEAEVSFRVIVRDLRFQVSSSSCYGTAVTIGPTCDSDSDGDGFGDPSDPDCPGAGEGDCDDADPDVWAPPGETGTLLYLPDKLQLAWDPPAAPGGALPLYDVLRTRRPDDFVSAAVCLESSEADRAASDGELPGASSEIFYYLVRARNDCSEGIGTLGARSDGTLRAGRDCP